MNMIKAGMVIKFNTEVDKNYRFGVVIECIEIKDSIVKENIGKIYYLIDECSNCQLPIKVTKEQISEVYGKIDTKGID